MLLCHHDFLNIKNYFSICLGENFAFWHQGRRMATTAHTLDFNSSTHIYKYSQILATEVYEP